MRTLGFVGNTYAVKIKLGTYVILVITLFLIVRKAGRISIFTNASIYGTLLHTYEVVALGC